MVAHRRAAVPGEGEDCVLEQMPRGLVWPPGGMSSTNTVMKSPRPSHARSRHRFRSAHGRVSRQQIEAEVVNRNALLLDPPQIRIDMNLAGRTACSDISISFSRDHRHLGLSPDIPTAGAYHTWLHRPERQRPTGATAPPSAISHRIGNPPLRVLAAMNRLKGTENVSLQMIRPSVKAMSIAALVLASSMQLGFSASGQRQSCNGVLVLDDGV